MLPRSFHRIHEMQSNIIYLCSCCALSSLLLFSPIVAIPYPCWWFPFHLRSACPPLNAYLVDHSQVLFAALAPPSCRVIAEPKLLLPWVQRVCSHVGRINLTALESARALTDALFDSPPFPFLFITWIHWGWGDDVGASLWQWDDTSGPLFITPWLPPPPPACCCQPTTTTRG